VLVSESVQSHSHLNQGIQIKMKIAVVVFLVGLCAIAQAKELPSRHRRQLTQTRTFVATEPQKATQQAQVYYYAYQMPDGSVQYVQAPAAPAPIVQQQPVIQTYQTYQQQLPQQQVYQAPASSGGLFSFLAKPLSAVANIVDKTGDVASTIIDLPFDVVDEVVDATGLQNTFIGQAAGGILDAGQAIIQTPLKVVSGVVQAPLRLGAGLLESIKE